MRSLPYLLRRRNRLIHLLVPNGFTNGNRRMKRLCSLSQYSRVLSIQQLMAICAMDAVCTCLEYVLLSLLSSTR